MSFDNAKWVWMNGDIIPWEQATFHVSAHALHYGSGVFEGIRCYETADGPAVFRLSEHLDRMFSSADAHSIPVPYPKDEIEEAICETIRRNEFADCYVRPICFVGSGVLSLDPRDTPIVLALLAWPWGAYLGKDVAGRGAHVTVSPWVKFNSKMFPAAAKACGQYLNSILAARDAHSRGFDEAVLLDSDGNISEGSGENLFLVKDDALLTNDVRSSILMGITRESVIEIARDLGYKVEVGPIKVDDLIKAQEAFFTGTAAEVTPIREVDGSAIGKGVRGPITTRIQETFYRVIRGQEPRYHRWLHYVQSGKGSALKEVAR